VVVLHSSVLLSVLLTAAHHSSVLQTLGRGAVWEGAHPGGSQPGRVFSGLMVTHLPTFLVGSQLAICVSRLW